MKKLLGLCLIFIILSLPIINFSPYNRVEAQIENSKSIKKWVLLGDTPRQEIKDVSTLTYSNYQLTFMYGSYYLTYRPYAIYNNQVYDLEDIIGLFPNIMQNVKIDRPPFAWKYSLNITNIPANIQSNIQAIGFKRVSTNLIWSDVEVRKEGYYVDGEQEDYRDTYYIIVKDRVRFSFTDLLDSDFLININRTDILITNIAPNIVNNSLYLDPSIELQEADTENLEDTYTDGTNPTTNYGTATEMRVKYVVTVNEQGRSYIKFNLSQVINAPNFDEITEAILYLNHTSEGNPPPDLNLNVSSHYVNNTIWSETVITHNNQPCGSTEGSFNASCNETPTDTVTIPDGQTNLWYSWNVTDAVLNYNTSDNYISLVLTADITGNTRQNGFKAFASKEWSLSSERPILNVTYSELVGAIYSLTVEIEDAGANNLVSSTYLGYNSSNIQAVNSTGFVSWSNLNNGTYRLNVPIWQNSTADNGRVQINSTDYVDVVISGSNQSVLVRFSVYNITLVFYDQEGDSVTIQNITISFGHNSSSRTVTTSYIFLVANYSNTPSTIYWQNNNVRLNTTDSFTATSYGQTFRFNLKIYSITPVFNTMNSALPDGDVSSYDIRFPNSTDIIGLTAGTAYLMQNGTSINLVTIWNAINVSRGNSFDAESGNPTLVQRMTEHSRAPIDFVGSNRTLTGYVEDEATSLNLTITITGSAGSRRTIFNVGSNISYLEIDDVNVSWTYSAGLVTVDNSISSGVDRYELIWAGITLTVYNHTGIELLYVNGTQRANGTSIVFLQDEVANITITLSSSYIFYGYVYNSNLNTSNPFYLTMNQSWTVDAYANLTYYITITFYTGISQVELNGSSVANNSQTAYYPSQIANISSTPSANYTFYRYGNQTTNPPIFPALPQHIHDNPAFHTVNSNQTFLVYALQIGAGAVVAGPDYSGIAFILMAIVIGFAFVLVLASRKR